MFQRNNQMLPNSFNDKTDMYNFCHLDLCSSILVNFVELYSKMISFFYHIKILQNPFFSAFIAIQIFMHVLFYWFAIISLTKGTKL